MDGTPYTYRSNYYGRWDGRKRVPSFSRPWYITTRVRIRARNRYNKNTDSTDYGDDEYNANEPDNIRYPHTYINYPEAGTTAEPTGNNNNNNDEESDNNNNDDEENNTEYIEPVPLGNVEDMYSERNN